MATKPIRFSLQDFTATSAKDWRDKVRRAESLGFSTFQLADHYIGPGPALAATNHPVQDIAAVPAMAMAAEATTTINIGCRVFCTGYRPIPVLLKEAFTLDFLSGGRLELGLGAGWLENEYDAMGIPFERPGVRIARLEEAVRLARQSMSGGMLDFHGEHVHAVGYEPVPRPPRGRIPIIIGGGAPRVLGLAGREADIVSINFNNRSGQIGPDSFATSTAEETRKKIGWIRDGAGDRFDDIELEMGVMFLQITDDRRGALEAGATAFGVTPEVLLDSPHVLVGSIDHVCDRIAEIRETLGISYFALHGQSGFDSAHVVARMTGR